VLNVVKNRYTTTKQVKNKIMTENQQRLIFWLSGTIIFLIGVFFGCKKNGTFKNSLKWWVTTIFYALLTSYAGALFLLLMYGITFDPNEKQIKIK